MAYAVYPRGGKQAEVAIELPAGPNRAEWMSPLTGRLAAADDLDHQGGDRELRSPAYENDIALRLTKRKACAL
jgi:hypothetical protein